MTFLFTDIQGSTRLLEELGDRYGVVLAEHHRRLRAVWDSHSGVEVDTAGDAFFVAFSDAQAAVEAAADAQAALANGSVRVRMGLHTGSPLVTETGYVGMDVHKAARIAALADGGQVLISSSTKELVSGDFQDLGLHRLKDLRAPERLFQLGHVEFAPLKSLHATNLPAQPNELIGRRGEIEDLTELIGSGARLVTLTGAGGTGKTRLALTVARNIVSQFPDGAWFVPLAPISDPSLVEQAIAQAVGVRRELHDELRSKRLLLVLDNLEQVLAVAPAIAELLNTAPGVHVLATSRERLHVAAEHEYPVTPLAVNDAVRLFVDRASAVGVDLAADEHVFEIARRLDGLPLALELAAVRTKVMTTTQISQRLSAILDLLTAGRRDAPARQRTLRATLEWSCSLLSDEEATTFAKLGVFPAGFDLDAAEEICGATIEAIAGTVDKSLLTRTAEGRFFMLETVRQFAAERADSDGLLEPLRSQHAAYYEQLATRLEPNTRDHRQRDTVRMLTIEQPNLRQALTTLAEGKDPLPQARLTAALVYFWYLTGQFGEGIAETRAAYSRLGQLDVPERGPLANGVALMCALTGEMDSVELFATTALDVGARFDDPKTILRGLLGIEMAASSRGEWAASSSANERQRELAKDVGDSWWLGLAWTNQAVTCRELGNYDASREFALHGAALLAETGDHQAFSGALCNAAHAELRLNHYNDARRRFLQALAVIQEHPLPEMTIWCLDGLAAVGTRTGDSERAARLLGAAEALVESTTYGNPGTTIELEETRAALEVALGAELATALRAEGAILDAAAAVDLALARRP